MSQTIAYDSFKGEKIMLLTRIKQGCRRPVAFLLTLILLVASSVNSRKEALGQVKSSPNMYAISNVAVVDVENGAVLHDQTVLIVEDRIEKVVSRKKLTIPEGTQIIDGKGLYLMPGLVDAHVHYFDAKTFGPLMVAHGVVMVRDMGNTNKQALTLREKLKKGEILGPEMMTTGKILDGVPPFIPPISVGCKTPEQGREAVRKQIKAGVDQIKVYSRLETDVFLAIVDESHKHGVKPVGHVPESVYIEDAAAVGQRSCEHLFGFGKVIAKLLGEPVKLETGGMGTDVEYFMRLDEVNKKELEKVLHEIRDSGMAVCPTILVLKHGAHMKEILAGDYPRLEYVSSMIKGIWKMFWGLSEQNTELAGKVWPYMQKFLYELHLAEVTLMVGTDLLFPGIIAGYSVHEEMELWQEAGLPPAEILRSASIVPAEFLGLDNNIGTVSEGKTASLVLVRANPLEDIRNADKIEGVFLRGRYFSRADLDQLLQQTKELCKR